jgi:hypothetical protein
MIGGTGSAGDQQVVAAMDDNAAIRRFLGDPNYPF